jgi:hypothetical protein
LLVFCCPKVFGQEELEKVIKRSLHKHDTPWVYLNNKLKPNLHEALGRIWNWNRSILLIKNLKLGPNGFTWKVGCKIIEMTCLLTWHNLWHQKIRPKLYKRNAYRMETQFAPLGPRSLLIKCYFFQIITTVGSKMSLCKMEWNGRLEAWNLKPRCIIRLVSPSTLGLRMFFVLIFFLNSANFMWWTTSWCNYVSRFHIIWIKLENVIEAFAKRPMSLSILCHFWVYKLNVMNNFVMRLCFKISSHLDKIKRKSIEVYTKRPKN